MGKWSAIRPASTPKAAQAASRPFFDDGDLDAERGEHRRVLDADDAAADDGEGAGYPVEVEDVVRGEDDLAIGGNARRRRRRGADGDHDVGARDALLAALRAHED